MVGLKVDFDLQITLIASSLYRLLAERLAEPYRRAIAKKISPPSLARGDRGARPPGSSRRRCAAWPGPAA
jgi:hypothetical protein